MDREEWVIKSVPRKVKSWWCFARPMSPRRKRFSAWMGKLVGLLKWAYDGV